MKRLVLALVIGTLFLSVLPVPTSAVTINPGVPVFFVGGNQNYSVTHAMDFSSISVAADYIGFNNTFFNVSSPSSLWINLTYLDDAVGGLGAGEEALDFNATSNGGTVFFNISGFSPGATYNVSNSSVHLVDCIANAGGVIGFNAAIVSSHFEITMSFGGMYLDVFDENTSLAISDWSVIISNVDGSDVYTQVGCSNTLFITMADCPSGAVTVLINASDYYSRIYSYIFDVNDLYYLDAYLSPINVSQLCRIDVIGPRTEYGSDPPLDDAYVVLSEYDGTSGVYQPISTFYTDANGQFFLYLITNSLYKVSITKSGYDDESSTFICMPSIYVYTFRMTPTGSTTPDVSYDLFGVNISFVCSMIDAGYMQQGNITISYNDINGSTVDTDIYLYESFNGTDILLNYSHNTSQTISLINGSINTSRNHYVLLYFNNTATFSDVVSPYVYPIGLIYVYLGPGPGDGGRTPIDIDDRINKIIGPSPFFTINPSLGWHTIIAIIPAFIVLLLLGPYHAGIAIIGCGLTIGATDMMFSYLFTNSFPIMLSTICPLIVVIGLVYIWIKRGSAETL